MLSPMCKAFLDMTRFLTLFTLDDLFRWGFLRRRLRFGAFSDDGMAGGPLDGCACHPAWSISPTLGRAGGCANLANNPTHRPAHLAWSGETRGTFPRSSHGFGHGKREHPLIMDDTHDIGPAFKRFWPAQLRRGPEQILLIEAIAMAKASGIHAGDHRQRRKRATNPPKPCDAWVALGATRPRPDDPYHRDRHVAHVLEMEVGPGRHLHGMAVGIRAAPVRIWRPMRGRIRPLKAPTVQGRSARLMRARGWRRAIHDPIRAHGSADRSASDDWPVPRARYHSHDPAP